MGNVQEGTGGIKQEEEENVLDGGRGGIMDFGDGNGEAGGVDGGLGGVYGELLEEGMEA